MKPIAMESVILGAILLVAAGCRDVSPPDATPLPESTVLPAPEPAITEAVEPPVREAEVPDAEVTASSEGQRWTVTEVWRLGGVNATGAEVFGNLLAVTMGPHGQVFVLDTQPAEISVFDNQGRFVRRFGGRGDGPGEFRTPQAMAWDEDDHLWVADLTGRYTIMDSLGNVVRTVSRPVFCSFRRAMTGVFDSDGAFVDERCIQPLSGVRFYRVDSSGAVDDAFPPVYAPVVDLSDSIARAQRLQGTTAGFRLPIDQALDPAASFLPRLVYRVQDRYVWFADSSELRILVRELSGDTLRVLETSHQDSLHLTAEQERLIDEAMSQSGLDRSDFAYGHQVVKGIQVLDDGHVLVQIDDQGEPGRTALDVFDPDGHHLGSLQLDFALDPDPAIASRGDTIIAIAKDEWGVGVVVRAVIHRPES